MSGCETFLVAMTVFLTVSIFVVFALFLRGTIIPRSQAEKHDAMHASELRRVEADCASWRNMALNLIDANNQLRDTNRGLCSVLRETSPHNEADSTGGDHGDPNQ